MANEFKTHPGGLKSEQLQPPPVMICSNQKTKNMMKITTAEGEIGVFRAERYYNMKLEDGNGKVITGNCGNNSQGKKKEHRADFSRQKGRSNTPSVSSESSWNSQTALLPNFFKNPSQDTQNKTKGRNLLANISCNRSCADKKSILVHKNTFDVKKEAFKTGQFPVILDGRMKFQSSTQEVKPKLKRTSGRSTREQQLAFPISTSQIQSLITDEDPRISLDVFGSNKLDKKELMVQNLERKLSVLKWDAIPKAKTLQSTTRSDQVNEDVESDASSDLFEIEHLSRSNGQPFTRQGSNGISNTCYAPSETSIEWSAVTASAVDFLSVTNYNEHQPSTNNQISYTTSRTTIAAKAKITADKDAQKNHAAGLLGCKSQKAVSVAEAAYRTSEKLSNE